MATKKAAQPAAEVPAKVATPPTASDATWRRVIDQAHDGDARNLLELLLRPSLIEGGAKARAIPGSFYALPQDQELRIRIVWALLHGPWRKAEFTLGDLMEKTDWGKLLKKPRISDFEIAVAALNLQAGATPDEFERHAGALGVGSSYLRRLIRARAPATKARRK